MLRFLPTGRPDQARPTPWEEHTHQPRRTTPQLELFLVLSEGSLKRGRRGRTVNSLSPFLILRLVDMWCSLCVACQILKPLSSDNQVSLIVDLQ